jgi:YVTN family beta-propeller protein
MPKGVSLSPDGLHAYVTNFGELNHKNVMVYDAKTLALTDTINVPGNVVESVLSPDGATLYVSNFRRGSVQFIDLKTKNVTHEIKTGENPKVLALSPDGKTLFAANWSSNSVTQIDTEKAEVVRKMNAGRQPRGMAITSNGTLYVANFWGESIDIFPGTDKAGDPVRTRVKTCKVPRHLALSPDEKTLYVSCLTASQLLAYDLSAVSPAVASAPAAPEVAPDSLAAAATPVVFTATTPAPATTAAPTATATPTPTATTTPTVPTIKVVHRAQIGRAPKSISVSPDGRYVYSADYGESRSVTVVDTTDFSSRVFPVPGMDRGSGVVVYPDGKHALVTGWYDSHLYLVGFQGTGGDPEEAAKKTRGWIHRAYTEDHGE